MHAEPDEIDVARFEAIVKDAEAVLAFDPAAALAALDGGFALWRGDALADLADEPSLRGDIARLEELRLAAADLRISTKLQLGLHSAVISELEVLTARYPLRERFWAQLMTALYRAGRQAEALDAYRRAREVLAVELGADPSSELQHLHEQILRQEVEPAPASTTFDVPDMDAADEPGTGPGSDEGTIQTFLIADIRGYTHFSQEHGDEAAGRLAARFAEVTTEVIEARGGSVIELRGDEALCIFPTTRRAIRAAIDLQTRFLAESDSDPTLPLPAGIGIDTGEAVPVAGGFRGRALNLAARLCGSARAGEILATREAIHMAGQMDGIRVEDRGLTSLKGLSEPVGIVRVVDEGEDPARWFAERFPPQLAPKRRSSNGRRVGIGAVAAVAVVALIAALLQTVGAEPARATFQPGIAIVDQQTGEPLASIPTSVIRQPAEVIYANESFWVHNLDPDSFVEIDAKTGRCADADRGSVPGHRDIHRGRQHALGDWAERGQDRYRPPAGGRSLRPPTPDARGRGGRWVALGHDALRGDNAAARSRDGTGRASLHRSPRVGGPCLWGRVGVDGGVDVSVRGFHGWRRCEPDRHRYERRNEDRARPCR